MAKRFTDNEKWKDAWFMDLPSKYKLFWLYLLDECNHAGIWKVNFKIAIFHIGENLEYSEVKRMLDLRIEVLNDEYWYIKKFIKYQYKADIKELNTKNKAHESVLKLLNEWTYFKPLTSPLLGVKDKDKDKDKYIMYNKDDFLKDWNEVRTKHLKKPSHLNRIGSFDDVNNFDSLKKDYSREEFKYAMIGLFKQEIMPNGNTSMQSNPSHFLKFFNSYLTAYYDKNTKLYGKKETL